MINGMTMREEKKDSITMGKSTHPFVSFSFLLQAGERSSKTTSDSEVVDNSLEPGLDNS